MSKLQTNQRTSTEVLNTVQINKRSTEDLRILASIKMLRQAKGDVVGLHAIPPRLYSKAVLMIFPNSLDICKFECKTGAREAQCALACQALLMVLLSSQDPRI